MVGIPVTTLIQMEIGKKIWFTEDTFLVRCTPTHWRFVRMKKNGVAADLLVAYNLKATIEKAN